MKLRHLAAAAATLTVAGLLAAAPVAFAQVPKLTQSATTTCGSAEITVVNPSTTQTYGWGFSVGSNAGGPAGVQGQFEVPPSKTVKHLVKVPEDAHGGDAFVSFGPMYGPDLDAQIGWKAIVVDSDCDDKPPVKYPADCEIGAGIDNGESGKQADADAPCLSNSPGYERDEVGKQCDVTSGEIGGGNGVVTEALKCEVPVTETPDPTTDPTTTPEPTTEPTDPPVADNGGSDSGSVDDGLNPGPITTDNGETVVVPSGGVETGGGPA